MKSLFSWLVLIVSITLLVSSCSEEDKEESAATADSTGPVVAEVTAVTTPTKDFTPIYTFSSDEAGTITYGGSCHSSTSSAIRGNTIITLISLRDATYSNCTITVTDSAANVSNTLTLTSFIVDTTAATLLEVTAVTNPTKDFTPNYTFSSDEAGTITYGGSCHSDNSTASSGNNLIVLNSLRDGTYDNCTVTVTDSAANASSALAITSFIVDSTAATLVEIAAVTTPTNDSTPDYTFSSDEPGTITYGGACSSSTTSATVGNNLITLLATADNGSLSNNTYDNCTITVSDNITNTRTLNISQFVIDTTSPWSQQSYIKAENNDTSDEFGGSVSISVDTIAVGATGEDSNQTTITNNSTTASDNGDNSSSGAVYVYERSGSSWTQNTYIKATNNDSSDAFGASVSIDVDTLAVGATGEDSGTIAIINGMTSSATNDNSSSGAAYVYKRYGGFWIQEAYIKAGNSKNGSASDNDSNFGHFVSIDGDTLAVSAIYEDSDLTTITNATTVPDNVSSKSASGAVYVYKRTGVTWVQEAYIKAGNSDNDSKFGYSVSLDGETLVVGAPYEDSDLTTVTNATSVPDNVSFNTDSGAVYIYKRSGATWVQEAYIKAANSEAGDLFGWSVSIDNDTLVVGAYAEDSNQSTISNDNSSASSDNSVVGSGAAYVYKRTGSSWEQEAYIKAVNPTAEDNFGYSVSIDNDTIVVGAYLEDSNQTTVTNGTTASDNNDNSSSGAVYVYKRTGSSWAQDAYIKASNNNVDDKFGEVVFLDGNTIGVGVQLEDSNQTTITNGTSASSNNDNSSSGAVYVYR